MDLLKMTNRTKIHEFYKKFKKGNFIFQATVLKFGDLLGGSIKLVKNGKLYRTIFPKLWPLGQKTKGHGI